MNFLYLYILLLSIIVAAHGNDQSRDFGDSTAAGITLNQAENFVVKETVVEINPDLASRVVEVSAISEERPPSPVGIETVVMGNSASSETMGHISQQTATNSNDPVLSRPEETCEAHSKPLVDRLVTVSSELEKVNRDNIYLQQEQAKNLDTIRSLASARSELTNQLQEMEKEVQRLKMENEANQLARLSCEANTRLLNDKLVSMENISSERSICQQQYISSLEQSSKLTEELAAAKSQIGQMMQTFETAENNAAIYESKCKVIENNFNSMNAKVENCELSAKISKLELTNKINEMKRECKSAVKSHLIEYPTSSQIALVRNDSTAVYEDQCDITACAHLSLGYIGITKDDIELIKRNDYSFVSYKLAYLMTVISDFLVEIYQHSLEYVISMKDYVLNVVIPSMIEFYHQQIVPSIMKFCMNTKVMASKMMKTSEEWYYENLSVYVEDYILIPCEEIYEAVHYMAYFTMAYCTSEEFPQRVWPDLIQSYMNVAKIINGFTSTHGVNAHVAGLFQSLSDAYAANVANDPNYPLNLAAYTDDAIAISALVLGSTLSLATLFYTRRYLLGIAAGIAVVLLSPLLLLWWLLVALPTKFIRWTFGAKSSEKKVSKRRSQMK